MAESSKGPDPLAISLDLFIVIVILTAGIEVIAYRRLSTNRIWRHVTCIIAIAQIPLLCWLFYLVIKYQVATDSQRQHSSQECSALTIFFFVCGLACIACSCTACIKLIINAVLYSSGGFCGPAEFPPLLPLVVIASPFYCVYRGATYCYRRQRPIVLIGQAVDDIPMQSLPISNDLPVDLFPPGRITTAGLVPWIV